MSHTYTDDVGNLCKAIKRAVAALQNVPCVGEVYDQQHADTHLRAILDLQEAVKEARTPNRP